MMEFVLEQVKNIVRKGEKADEHHFFLFSHYFKGSPRQGPDNLELFGTRVHNRVMPYCAAGASLHPDNS